MIAMKRVSAVCTALQVLSLATALLLPLVSCGSAGSEAEAPQMPGSADSLAGQQSPPGQPETPPSGTLPSLPQPRDIPRMSSELSPSFFADGYSGGGWLGSNRVDYEDGKQLSLNGQFKNFEPVYDPGDPISDLAWCSYMLSPQGQVNGSKRLRFFWQTAPDNAQEDFWVGLANYARNRWDWTHGPQPGDSLSLEEHYDEYMNAYGELHLVVLFTGHDLPSLDYILLGDALFHAALKAEPDHADSSLSTSLSPSFSLIGGNLARVDYDLDGDGEWELLDAGTNPIEQTYSELGIHEPAVRLWTDLEEKVTASCKVYVTDPANIGPTALLEADVSSGDAPLHVQLDGSASFDQGSGKIIACEWDLDDDGIYELQTGELLYAETTLVRAGLNKIRMRVRDNDLEQSTATVTIDVDTGFHIEPIAGSDMPQVSHIAMCLIGEGTARRPAFVYSPEGTGKLSFCAAQDQSGIDWADIHVINDFKAYYPGIGLAEVAGIPAVAYTRVVAEAGHPVGLYKRALSTSGSTWGEEVVLMDEVTGPVDLAVVDGRPAAALSAQQSWSGLYYISAEDATGSQWNAPLQLRQSKYSSDLSAPLILQLPGQPVSVLAGTGVPLSGHRAGCVSYTALNAQASEFSAEQLLLDTDVMRMHVYYSDLGMMLAINGGKPQYNGLNFLRATQLDEELSQDLQVLDPGRVTAGCLAIAGLYGKPVIVYSEQMQEGGVTKLDLKIRMALDMQGSSWSPEMTLDAESSVGYLCSAVTTVFGRPVIVYGDDKHDQLRCALWY